MPLDAGTPIPFGKLTFTLTGTSTPSDVYTTQALSVAHSNPVEADADGIWPAIFLDPAVTYRVHLTDASDVEIHPAVDGVNANVYPAVEAGSFTGTLTGYASGPTGTINYIIQGAICRLFAPANILGTSNATAMTMTGLPAACVPSSAVSALCPVADNGAGVVGQASISASSSTITFAMGSSLSATGFTNSGTKGINAGWTIEYPL